MEIKKKTVLVVDDDVSQRKVLNEKFTIEGYNVLLAENGEEGLKIALEKHPDIILLDITMPKMDGPSMFTELSRDKWGIEVPVIMLSNLSDSKYIVENIKNGVTDYIVKSDSKIADVVKKVKEILEK